MTFFQIQNWRSFNRRSLSTVIHNYNTILGVRVIGRDVLLLIVEQLKSANIHFILQLKITDQIAVIGRQSKWQENRTEFLKDASSSRSDWLFGQKRFSDWSKPSDQHQFENDEICSKTEEETEIGILWHFAVLN